MRTHAHKFLAVLVGFLFLIGPVARSQVTFSVTAAADTTGYGYNLSTPYTFNITTGSNYPSEANFSSTNFSSNTHEWNEETIGNSQLFMTMEGTGLLGSFIRPVMDNFDPYSSIYVLNNVTIYSVTLFAANDSSHSVGLTTLNTTALGGLQVNLAVALPPATFSNTYIDPAIYFLTNVGTYTASGSVYLLGVNMATIATFSITNLTITAVPEPSTYATFAGIAALGLAAWRRRRLAA